MFEGRIMRHNLVIPVQYHLRVVRVIDVKPDSGHGTRVSQKFHTGCDTSVKLHGYNIIWELYAFKLSDTDTISILDGVTTL